MFLFQSEYFYFSLTHPTSHLHLFFFLPFTHIHAGYTLIGQICCSFIKYIFNFVTICIFKNYILPIFRILFSCPFPFFLPTFRQSFESVLRHPKDNRTQISELGQTLIDGGILDELIGEKLAAFNSRSEQLNQQVRTS